MLPGTGRHARLSRWLARPNTTAAQGLYALNIRLKMRVAIMPAEV